MPPEEIRIQVNHFGLVNVRYDPVIISRLSPRSEIRRSLGWQVHQTLQRICVSDLLIASETLEQLSNPHIVLGAFGRVANSRQGYLARLRVEISQCRVARVEARRGCTFLPQAEGLMENAVVGSR